MIQETLYAGIDVSCDKLDVAFIDDDGRAVRSHRIYDNDPKGWTALADAIIDAAAQRGGEARIVCGMESTGNMHQRLAEHLRAERRRALEVHVINPRAVKHHAKARLQDSKTDRIDCRLIADFLRCMRPPVGAELPEGFAVMQESTRTRRRYIEARTDAKNRSHKLLRYHFPGYRKVFPRLSKALLTALYAFPMPDLILEAGVEGVAEVRMGRRRIGEAVAEKLVALADQAPKRQSHRATQLIMRDTVGEVLDISGRIAELDGAIAELVEALFPGNPLLTIPGIGEVSAAAILAEVGDITRFGDKRSFVGYCGVYPIRIQSGRSDWTWRMTYKGNRMLKMTLLLASAAARQYNPVIRALYERLRSKGKSTKAAGGAIARKLAELVFTLLSRNEPWDAEKAQAGMARAVEMAGEVVGG